MNALAGEPWVGVGGAGVAVGPGVGVGTAPQPSVQASQQLDDEPTHAEPPFGALQFKASLLVEHFVWPFEFVRQHVTKPGLPHVDLAAHLIRLPLQFLGSIPASARVFATVAAHLTYWPWLVNESQGQSAST
jgi:hypothetical protein